MADSKSTEHLRRPTRLHLLPNVGREWPAPARPFGSSEIENDDKFLYDDVDFSYVHGFRWTWFPSPLYTTYAYDSSCTPVGECDM